ncbi:hypothetical protein Gdia_0561 [Gluconacetobacter diazotrophicus PA1 5]|uniref:hypothetical protein n=1 Tax=Gluconacetobacter diazotrophicus TaxID=33996 RepID=UPI000173B33E|nr:hypothetical protein [Gluconacetobacter diazotrophicus]ACI50354.1 hypothetical protein Gdia_0561 [Gluconacetobacter diazotrophicus PA1 5]
MAGNTNGSYSIRVALIDDASSALKTLNKNLMATQAPMNKLSREFNKFTKLSGIRDLGNSIGSLTGKLRMAIDPAVTLAKALTGITGIAGAAGLGIAIKTASDRALQISNTARVLGQSPRSVRAEQNAGSLLFRDQSAVTSQIQATQDRRSQVIQGHATQYENDYMTATGRNIGRDDALTTLRSELDYIKQQTQRYNLDPGRVRDLMGQFGIDQRYTGMSGTDLQRAISRGQSNSGNLSNQDYDNLDKMNQSITDIQQKAVGIIDEFAAKLAPALQPGLDILSQVEDKIEKWLSNSPQAQQMFDNIGTAVKNFGDWLLKIDFDKVESNLETIIDDMGGIKTAAEALIGISLVGWFSPLILATGSLALNLLKIGTNLNALKNSGLNKAIASGTVGSTLGSGARLLGRLIGPGITVGMGAYEAGSAITDYHKGQITRRQEAERLGGASGGVAGSLAGAAGGAAVGGAIGSMVPLVGTVIGAGVGGAIGGYFGWQGGAAAGTKGTDLYRDMMGYDRGAASLANNFSNKQISSLMGSITDIEGARYDQMGGAGNKYLGKYQLGQGAIADGSRMLGISTPSNSELLKNPQLQDQIAMAFEQSNYEALRKSPEFRALNSDQQIGVMAYAHNQGAGGAIKWLRTGVAGKDAFGTSGTEYQNLALSKLGTSDNGVAVPPVGSGNQGGSVQMASNDSRIQLDINFDGTKFVAQAKSSGRPVQVNTRLRQTQVIPVAV